MPVNTFTTFPEQPLTSAEFSELDTYSSVVHLLHEMCRKYADRPAFEQMGRLLTYADWARQGRDFGAYLQSLGLQPGDRIALMLPNLLQFPVALLGAWNAGLVVVTTNPLYTPYEMKYQFGDAGVKAIVIADTFAANLAQIIDQTSIRHVVLTGIGDRLGLKGALVNFVVRRVRKMVPAFRLPGAVPFNTALQIGRRIRLSQIPLLPDAPALLPYTGGTTGVSKGAVLSHRNLLAATLQMHDAVGPHFVPGHDTLLCALPLYHIYALQVNLLTAALAGGKNVLVVNARDLPALIRIWKNAQPSMFVGINTLYNALLNHPDFASVDCSRLKVCGQAGMALQPAVGQRWFERTGCPVVEGYGMTETAGGCICNPFDGRQRLGTIGVPMRYIEVRIVDENGHVRGDGPDQVGELELRGPQVMKGYWNRPDTAGEVFHNGWLRTGDLGFRHPDGYIQLVDRKKDLIIVSGFNVFPNEVEDVIVRHPAVLECAVVAAPDDRSGEVVRAVVVKKDASLTAEQVVAHCRQFLTAYKVPRQVVFCNELPKSNIGKILRRELRDAL